MVRFGKVWSVSSSDFFFVLPRSPARGSLLHVLAFRAGVFGWHRVRYPSLNELVYILLSSHLGVVFASSTSLVPLPVLLHYIYLFSILGLFFFFFHVVDHVISCYIRTFIWIHDSLDIDMNGMQFEMTYKHSVSGNRKLAFELSSTW